MDIFILFLQTQTACKVSGVDLWNYVTYCQTIHSKVCKANTGLIGMLPIFFLQDILILQHIL